jgi:hypothetical protein
VVNKQRTYNNRSRGKEIMSATVAPTVSTSALRLQPDLEHARDLGILANAGSVTVRAVQGRSNVWLALALDGAEVAHLRLGPSAGEITHVQTWSKADGTAGCEFTTSLGPVRAKIEVHEPGTVRCTTSLMPAQDTQILDWPRDLFVAGDDGTIHTSQRGLRSGIVFLSGRTPAPFSVFYFQNFSSLNDYFAATKRTPANTVGGTWPELGYAPPAGDDCILSKARDIVVSDAFVSLTAGCPHSEAVASHYLDQLAVTYVLLDKPAPQYHDWAQRARGALRDLSLSPLCSYARQNRRYLTPYAGDETKPPESMVQLTVAVNAGEYDTWRDQQSALSKTLRENAASFFNEDVGSLVRWLPGEPFDDAQADDNMNHEAMDSWYLHHALFNLFRVARDGDARAKAIFQKSLPFMIRVAHRFDYRWPVFFNVDTIDVIRAEAKPGEGGETDVAGLYGLVMIHAYEMFGEAEYLNEAEIAVSRLHGLGFNLAYQRNTTGFAAEAALRLWKMTNKPRYLALSETCVANLFDNMWLWQCDYENARHYPTFFGLFPLRDAPYIAPYEELEAHAKFHEYLSLGGDDVRPALKLLLSEYQKYALDRCWYYYPDALPIDAVAQKTRNGHVERSLSVPLEDLQDGRETSGQVGQEVYGAGLPFVLTARHYMRLDGTGMMAFCNYPMYDFVQLPDGATWRAGGDPRGNCELRVAPSDLGADPRSVTVTVQAGSVAVPVAGKLSAEGHATFNLRGGQTITIQCTEPSERTDQALIVGAMASAGEH